MHGQGLAKPVWGKEGDRIVAGTLKDGSLVVKMRQSDGSYLVDLVHLGDVERRMSALELDGGKHVR